MSNIGVLAKIMGTGYTQFGKKILATQLRFSTLEAIFEVDEQVQRKLDPIKRVEIREFMIKALEAGEDFYFSPFVFSARGGIKETRDGWELEPGCKLYILDGMHRSASLSSAISHLKARKESAEEGGRFEEAEKLHKYIESLREYPVSMQVYLELEQQQERQLFSDINSERREAHIGQVMLYDKRDGYTELTRKIAKNFENRFEIEQNLSRITFHNSSLTSLATMRKCLIAMFEGNISVKRGEPSYRCKPDEAERIAKEFFDVWSNIFPRQTADRSRYVSGFSGIQISLGYCVNQLMKKYDLSYSKAIKGLLILKKGCTWKHDDFIFQHLYDSSTRKIKNHSANRNIQKTALEFIKIIENERHWSNDYK
ncbi:hypothetical protein BGM26_03545 [Bacillus sp. FJAT-29790]|uniref:DNA sulfur modification protein DndB n=1 Tax=Bacillus sp. FJAT-29790 TaxID=1895002 RepID=UPI001C24C806|nr:DNA sulfur modification protein DndB [Bacillus sp. FJAT-29790]MBU8878065.1 hypothetical protein [Bacillus sp. FJAT-29790]